MEPADAYLKEYLEEIKDEKVSPELLRRVKKLKSQSSGSVCPHCGKPVTPFKKPLQTQHVWNGLWLLGTAASFALSFVFPKYFFQFVALTILFGVKWIVDQRATKTQILIYKALKEETPETERQKIRGIA